MKPAKLQRQDPAISKAMVAYFGLFSTIEDAQAFQKAAHATDRRFLPPCVRVVIEGGLPTALYWRWLTVSAEVWS